MCFSKDWSDYYPYVILSSEYKLCISLCLSLNAGQWMREGRELGVEGGQRRVQDMLAPSWRCWATSQSLLLYHLHRQHGSWLSDTLPCHCQPFLCLWTHAQVIQNIRRLKSYLLNYDYKVFFTVCQVNATCAFYWPAWREDDRLRTSSSLLLQCIVCNSKLYYMWSEP